MINYYSNILDTRDLDERLDELEELQSFLTDAGELVSDLQEQMAEGGVDAVEMENAESDLARCKEDFGDDERAELKMLQDARDEVGREWSHGETLILDEYFEEWCEQFADDIGAVDRNASWPLNHIDWKAAAEELKEDYSYVELDDNKFWFRMS